jgi:oligopeptide/dipeptide ABC transporter ATP-binding protein
MEVGTSDEVCRAPAHPYSRLLTKAVPSIRRNGSRAAVPVAVADDDDQKWASGCPFARRCPHFVESVCASAPPRLEPNRLGRLVACHRRDEADVLEDYAVPVTIGR